MRRPKHSTVVALVACVILSGSAVSAAAAPCPGNPDALGVSRVITVSAKDYSRIGRMQYRTSLPLGPREVVLTFDDGPLPPYTDRVLAILARECVQATFFLVGRMVAANPQAARQIYAAGHTIGNHSQNHVIHFDQISEARAEHEIDAGMTTISAALGGARALAPFFRIPGLGRTRQVEGYLQAKSLVVWSADTVADDWRRINSTQVMQRALRRLEARGKGVLLLHDIQPRMVLMLPTLLAELKRRNFHIVHVVPEDRPALAPILTASLPAPKQAWPRLAAAGANAVMPAAAPRILLAGTDAAPEEKTPLPPRRKIQPRRKHVTVASAGALAVTPVVRSSLDMSY